MSAVSPSHPHFLPLLLPFSLVPPPKGKVFSLSLCTPHPLTPCPALAPSPSSALSSQEWLCLLGCPAASPPATLLLLVEGTTAKPCSSRGDKATSQLRRSMGWSWGGREPPSHTHLLQSQFIPPPAAVSMEKCQDSQQGSEPCCWWEPSRPGREAGAGAQGEPRACTPSLTAGSTQVGSAPGWFHPTCSRLKAPEKTWSEEKGVSCSGTQSLAGAASPTWLVPRSPGSRRPVPMMARWKDASGSDATSTRAPRE